ncbi:hypothetical protein QE152_g8165 [Popillia japonica]|uniref:Endonuclease/exonuclease/phosphatase domain-containing protein n=1 Tax=Popillia japonica TaxID=7064 RepID=A0AAW1MCD8_POPJA
MDKLEVILVNIHERYTSLKLLVAGDFNVNFLAQTPERSQLVNCLLSFGLHIVFEEPSRITNTAATCIDNICTNSNIADMTGEVMTLHLSDHFSQLLQISIAGGSSKKEKVQVRNLSRAKLLILKERLSSIDWNRIQARPADQAYTDFPKLLILKERLSSIDWNRIQARPADQAYTDFHSVFLDIFSAVVPIVQIPNIKQGQPIKPIPTFIVSFSISSAR